MLRNGLLEVVKRKLSMYSILLVSFGILGICYTPFSRNAYLALVFSALIICGMLGIAAAGLESRCILFTQILALGSMITVIGCYFCFIVLVLLFVSTVFGVKLVLTHEEKIFGFIYGSTYICGSFFLVFVADTSNRLRSILRDREEGRIQELGLV